MRKENHINFNWKYKNEFKEEYLQADYDDSTWLDVNLPHTNEELPYNNFDEKTYQKVTCYRKELNLLSFDEKKLLYIHFAGVMTFCKVYLNGHFVGEHKGGFTPFRILLQREFLLGKEKNMIAVMVDSTERKDIPPFGFVIDYLTYGGIYRQVKLEAVDDLHLKHVMVSTRDVLTKQAKVEIRGEISYQKNQLQSLEVRCVVYDSKTKHQIKLTECMVENHTFVLEEIIEDIKLWDIDNPNLYYLDIEIIVEGEVVDQKTVRFGFRQVEFKENGFFLNNKAIKIRGLNRHQSFPYVGFAMPKSAQEEDADLLKNELGLNAVRLSHYPQSDHFMNRCDEIGLLVFDEIPGWQHIGNEAWQEVALMNVEEMIKKDYNHPSVIIWGVRINESKDHPDFYKKTNARAHKLDNTRQTGGVRCIKNSQLFEDVYTYNDFSHTGNNDGILRKRSVTKEKKPYLITEYNGHMYPTKKFDDEKHRVDHMKRHLKVLNDINKDPLVSGGFGWCMFDYNTHKDFGSGDKICYHGVMDMFRINKHAAYAYASQQEDKPVLHIANSMQIGEFEASMMSDIYVATNCDYVKFFINDIYISKFQPREDLYPDLVHPPVVIDDFIGDRIEEEESFSKKDGETIKKLLMEVSKKGEHLGWMDKIRMLYIFVKYKMSRLDAEDLYTKYFAGWGGESVRYRLEGFKNEECVITKVKGQVRKPKLVAQVNRKNLVEEQTYDVSRVVIRLVDDYGNDLYYANDSLELSSEGEIDIVGPKRIALIGGSIGIWVKSKGRKGKGVLTVDSERFRQIKLEFEVN